MPAFVKSGIALVSCLLATMMLLASSSCTAQSSTAQSSAAPLSRTGFAAARSSAPATLTWHSRVIEKDYGAESRMQCVSTTWCIGANSASPPPVGSRPTFIYDGDEWSHDAPGAPYSADALSCVSRSFCLSEHTDPYDNGDFLATRGPGNGHLQRWNGTSWKLVAALNVRRSAHVALSCGAITLCAMTNGEGDVYTFSGKNYRINRFTPSPSSGIGSVACSGASFCLALGRQNTVDGRGRAWIFDGSTWSAPTTFGHHPVWLCLGVVRVADVVRCSGLRGTPGHLERYGVVQHDGAGAGHGQRAPVRKRDRVVRRPVVLHGDRRGRGWAHLRRGVVDRGRGSGDRALDGAQPELRPPDLVHGGRVR